MSPVGQNDADMMWHTTMNPETRRLIKVSINDVEKMERAFELFLGDEVSPRREYIEKYSYKYA